MILYFILLQPIQEAIEGSIGFTKLQQSIIHARAQSSLYTPSSKQIFTFVPKSHLMNPGLIHELANFNSLL
jgi:hypothetical protein